MVEQRQEAGVESFPRGGVAPRKTAEEPTDPKLKRKSLSVETDFLFGKKKEETPTATKSKKRKTSTGGAQSMLPVGGGGVIVPSNKKKSSPPTIEALGFSKLAQNTKVLAVVKEVQDEFAVVSLPNLLTGYMLPSDTSDYPLPSCLKVGQTLAVAVQKVVTENVKGQPTPRRRIQVSALPKALNVRDEDMFQKKNLPIRGQITSIEDHGCLVNLGHGRKGFLKFEDIQGKYAIVNDDDDDADDEEEGTEKEHTLLPGRLLDFYILSNSNNVYSLKLPSKKTLANQTVAPPATSKSAPYTLSSITPGWLVNAKIEAMAKNGLCVTFLGNVFRGSIEIGHLGGYHIPTNKDDDAWKAVFQKHQHFPARVIAVDIPTKLIRLTLLPHLMEYKVPPPLPSVGTIIEECTVVRTDPGIGALFALPEAYTAEDHGMSKKLLKSSELFQNIEFQEAASIRAVYVHISKALEGEKDANSVSVFGKEFAPSTKHKVRIMSHGNWMDGVASGACAPSILEAHVLTHSDLKAGQVYKQVPVVTQLQGGSVLVQLGGNGIRALVPPLHLLDSSNANSEYRKKIMQEKFTVDAKVDVRVLWVDPIKKKCLATAKKSLVKAPGAEIISSYEDLKLGGKATGFVSKVDKKAMYVTFCNRVYGVVTARSLAAELGMENIQDNYAIGDVVTCRIAKLKKRTSKRSSLSNASDEEDNDADDGARAYWEVTLSLKVDSDDVINDDDQLDLMDVTNPKQVQIQAGAILPMKSMKIVELVKGKRKDKGAFVPGYAIVSIKSKHLLDSSECDTMVSNMECKLPYDQILDEYSTEDIESVEALDALAESVLRVGKKINQKGIILTDPRKSNVDYSSGIGKLTVVSIRKNLIQTAERQYAAEDSKPEDIILPAPKTTLFVGALIQGYVAQVDPRYGAFIRFLDGLTGLVPKKSGGLDMPLFETVVSRVQAIDEAKGQMHLQPLNLPSNTKQQARSTLPLNVGDSVEAKIEKIDFFSITLHILDDNLESDKTHAILHCTMKDSALKKVKYHKKPVSGNHEKITKFHPFYGLKAGQLLSNLTVVAAKRRRGKFQVYLTDRSAETSEDSMAPRCVSENSELEPGMKTSVVVTGVAPKNKGVYVEASPFVKGFIPGIELSKDLKILNDIESHVAVGSKITCCVMDQKQWNANHAKNMNQSKKKAGSEKSSLMFSVLSCDGDSKVTKPARGDLIIGRIHRGLKQALSPSLMLALRGGFVGRCCITELEENDEWENMPIGRLGKEKEAKKEEKNDESMDVDEEEEETAENEDDESNKAFPDGKYVECRVLKGIPKHALVDISLRSSRVDGDIDDDVPAKAGDTVQGYVVETNKKGCFVRLARNVEGRVTLKELCDGFLPDPAASFPPGRLVVGRVKAIRNAPKKAKHANNPVKFQVDLDMRESTLLDQKKQLTFDDIELDSKYNGTVTRIESYGVFVQIEKCNVSGLTHMSECSDKFIKKLGSLYDPGDLVKVLVIKKDVGSKKLGFSMKASHFEDDEDSDDDSSIDAAAAGDEEMVDMEDSKDDNGLDSDDENFGAKLASQMEEGDADSDNDASGSESEDDSDDGSGSDSDDDSEEEEPSSKVEMDTDIGFDWGARGTSIKKSSNADEDSSDDSDSDDSNSDDGDMDKPSSHKSRKKQAQRRREEQEITRRETALADGTADENPETAGDFERLLAGNPNSSELWIRYMAFYLSLADIPSARKVADKALGRIKFREETEKLNVWTALLTLEHKYGSDDSLQKTVDKACGHCNPKQVYLRVCEILEKDASNSESVTRANNMFAKMCKKFKSKKKVWLAHLEYLLKQSKHQDAHALLKRALLSLATYKHAETMSKFAQLEFEHGSAERARTLFDGILEKYPKRLDLFFVYLDKEVKFGKASSARASFDRKVEEGKLTDKQMKSLFKKWFRMEEEHGSEEQQQHVKDTAKEYVQRTSN